MEEGTDVDGPMPLSPLDEDSSVDSEKAISTNNPKTETGKFVSVMYD